MRSSLIAVRHAYGLFKSDSRVDTGLAVLLVIGVLLPFLQQYHRSKSKARPNQ